MSDETPGQPFIAAALRQLRQLRRLVRLPPIGGYGERMLPNPSFQRTALGGR